MSKKNHRKIVFYKILFLLSVFIYLFTRIYKIEDFPIYFFSDEAIQAVKAEQLVNNDFKDETGTFLPVQMRNFFNYNLGTSIYLNIPFVIFFGKNIWSVRLTSVLITLLGSLFCALIYKNLFMINNYWLAIAFLAGASVFFLHSRTGFETVIASSFFAAFLYLYLRFLKGKKLSLLYSVIFAALSFHSYAGIWFVIAISFVLLFLINLKTHLMQIKVTLLTIFLAILLFLPFIRFQYKNKNTLNNHLTRYNSYLKQNIPTMEKAQIFLEKYILSFNPKMLFFYNETYYSPRHSLKNYGYLPLWSYPIIILGLFYAIVKFKKPVYKTILIFVMTSPLGGVLIDPGPTRNMPVIVSFCLLFGIGIKILEKLIIKTIRRNKYILLSVIAFILIQTANLSMTFDALKNGPTWFTDYGLYGMQWGTKQVFTKIPNYIDKYENIIMNPDYANATDIYKEFFLLKNQRERVRMAKISDWLDENAPQKDTLYINLASDFELMKDKEYFKNIKIKEVINSPDGKPAFIFFTFSSQP